MGIFKDENGKTYVAVLKCVARPWKAVTVANYHFKTNKNNLVVFDGNIAGDELKLKTKNGNAWVVTRKEKS